MLPGFRFLFAAIVMCMSVLVFGLGATALMRAAHEDFATNTSWRAPPEPRFAEQEEAAKPPILAVLSVQPHTSSEPDVDTAAAPAEDTTASASPTPETTASLTPAATPAPEAAQHESESATASTQPDSASTQAENATPAAQAEVQAPAAIAAVATSIVAMGPAVAATESATIGKTIGKAQPLPNEPAPLAPPQSPTPVLADAPTTHMLDEAATRIATLGGPPVPIADAAPKAADDKSEREALNKKLEAERARERRRLMAARRARLEQQAAAEQAANPFAPHPLIGTPQPVSAQTMTPQPMAAR
jgi:hypothetical protein